MPEQVSVPDYIRREARAAGVPEELALAVAEQESSFNPTAVGPEITAGPAKGQRARGTFQIVPTTWQSEQLGDDIDDPVQNIRGGVKYLRTLLDRHQGDVQKVLATYGGVVTDQQYVPSVMARFGKFRRPEVGTPPPLRPLQTGQPASAYVTARPEAFTGEPPPGERRIGPAPGLGTRISRYVTPTIGAIAGGAKGAALGAPAGPVGMFVGGVAGAGLGAGAGELIQAGTERILSPYIGQPPPTAAGTVSRVAEATQAGMVGEGAGRILGPVVTKAAAPFARALKPTAREAIRTFTTPAGKPLVLPSEVSESRLLGLAENIASGSFTSGQRVAALQAERQTFAEQQVLDVLGSFGSLASPEEAGRAVTSGRKAAIEAFRQGERNLWERRFMPLGEQVPIATPKLDQFIAQVQGKETGAVLPNAGLRAAETVAQMSAGQPILIGGKPLLLADMNAALRTAVQQSGAVTGPQTAAQFSRTVSDLGKLVRSLEKAARTDPTKNNQLGLAKRLHQIAREDLEDSLSKSPHALSAYTAAREYSRLGNERLFNETLRKLSRQAPEKVVGKILRKNNSTAINAVREAVDPQAFEKVQSVAMEEILRADPKTGKISWAQVLNRLNKYGDDTIDTLFPSGQAKAIRRVSLLMEGLKRKPSEGAQAGMWIIRGGQAGAAGALLTGTAPVTSGAVLLTPPMLARIMTNPKGIKWLTTGLSAPKSKAGARAAGQLLSFIEREAVREDEESQVGTPPPTVPRSQPVNMRAGIGSPPP